MPVENRGVPPITHGARTLTQWDAEALFRFAKGMHWEDQWA